MKKHKFKQENCTSCVRDKYISTTGYVVTVTGQHAFSWTATIMLSSECITSITFATRIELQRELNKRYPKRKRIL